MKTHEEMIAEMMKRPEVRAEVERLERKEMLALDVLLKERAKKQKNTSEQIKD